jgi:hypothetical protein
MATRVKVRAAELHGRDPYLWALDQVEALRAGRLDDLDLDHLAEEIEGLAISIRSGVRSRTRRIIEHLLKLEYSPAVHPRHGWRRTLREQRSRLRDNLTPSLRRLIEDDLEQLFLDARENAADDLRSRGEDAAAAWLPAKCAYTVQQIEGGWVPDRPCDPA